MTDVYQKQPNTTLPLNYQLKQDLHVKGRYVQKPLGPVRTSVTTDGYTLTLHHMPKLKVANADICTSRSPTPTASRPPSPPGTGPWRTPSSS